MIPWAYWGFLILALILSIKDAYFRFTKREFSDKVKKKIDLAGNIIIAVYTAILIYDMTDSLIDYIWVILLSGTLFAYAYIMLREFNIDQNILLMMNFLVFPLSFLLLKVINSHLISAFNLLFVFLLGVIVFKHNLEKEENSQKKFIWANVLGIFAFGFMFIIFDGSYYGISKQEIIAKDYLIREMNYTEDDIKEIESLYSRDVDGERVFIAIKEERQPEITKEAFIFIYKDGEIIKTEVLE